LLSFVKLKRNKRKQEKECQEENNKIAEKPQAVHKKVRERKKPFYPAAETLLACFQRKLCSLCG